MGALFELVPSTAALLLRPDVTDPAELSSPVTNVALEFGPGVYVYLLTGWQQGLGYVASCLWIADLTRPSGRPRLAAHRAALFAFCLLAAWLFALGVQARS